MCLFIDFSSLWRRSCNAINLIILIKVCFFSSHLFRYIIKDCFKLSALKYLMTYTERYSQDYQLHLRKFSGISL